MESYLAQPKINCSVLSHWAVTELGCIVPSLSIVITGGDETLFLTLPRSPWPHQKGPAYAFHNKELVEASLMEMSGRLVLAGENIREANSSTSGTKDVEEKFMVLTLGEFDTIHRNGLIDTYKRFLY